MKTTKITSIILAVIMIFSAAITMAGCGKKGKAPETRAGTGEPDGVPGQAAEKAQDPDHPCADHSGCSSAGGRRCAPVP